MKRAVGFLVVAGLIGGGVWLGLRSARTHEPPRGIEQTYGLAEFSAAGPRIGTLRVIGDAQGLQACWEVAFKEMPKALQLHHDVQGPNDPVVLTFYEPPTTPEAEGCSAITGDLVEEINDEPSSFYIDGHNKDREGSEVMYALLAEDDRSASGVSGCDAPENDLSKEPTYPVNYIHRWTNDDGCPVRLDILMTRQGADACGGSKVADILMGTPLGAPHSSSRARIYIKDPTGQFGMSEIQAGYEADADLPEDATDSGYRQKSSELWTVPDGDAIYLVSEDQVERWPHVEAPPTCG